MPYQRENGSSVTVEEVYVGKLSRRVQHALEGIDRLLIYHTELTTMFRGINEREGLLLHGSGGWSEAAPFWGYSAPESAIWLSGAIHDARVESPAIHPSARIPVNVTIPVCSPESAARRVWDSGGCLTAKVKVADPRSTLEEDCQRVRAVARALLAVSAHGDTGCEHPAYDTNSAVIARAQQPSIRVDANGAWDVDTAMEAIARLDESAHRVGGLEYVEQPCVSIAELAQVRRGVDVPIAADESIRRADDPLAVARAHAADVAIIKLSPLGGTLRARQIAEETDLRVVISSALETSIGLTKGAYLAALLAQDGMPVSACGLATAQLLAADVVKRPLLPVNGSLSLETMAPNEELIGRGRTPDDGYQRWVQRLEDMCSYL